MNTSDFDFELPENLIASHPLERRDASRMLVLPKNEDKHIRDFLDYLQPGDVVVFNNSKVIPARFDASGYEITLHTHISDNTWWGFAKKFNKLQIGEKLKLTDGTEIEVVDKNDESGLAVKFLCNDVLSVLDRVGKMPLPPYMKRPDEESDRDRYQTVYANPVGSMAAPTAGLHFTNEMLSEIEKRGAKIVKITLHVGAGTWMPVKTEDLSKHKMHSEWGQITTEQASIINSAKRVIAVGTTSLRLLESAAACLIPSECEVLPECQRLGMSPPPEGGVSPKWRQGGENRKYSNRALSAAKSLRQSMTMYECLLWKKLRKSPNGFAFRKQHPVGKYIVDFINLDKKLIIELDGALHGEERQIIHDAIRDKFLQDLGFRIIRFWNNEVFKKMDMVLDTIYHYLTHDDVPDLVAPPRLTSSATPPSRGGDIFLLGVRQKPRVQPFCATTDIFITPGYKFQVVDVLLTNFHLPKSTLFMLVCAFAGTDEMKSAYAHAVAEKYRFFSYGDCCLLFNKKD